ncbi:unnamed protein product [Cylindrotheca closterium]|uniref:Uncharacterized protein n=1 Tax=Cylindrotheca closterium TaxID=2856 RepID=A0AAD2CHE7_9STRA|nr:unnamed protein product [Cylindrotheca closterium]
MNAHQISSDPNRHMWPSGEALNSQQHNNNNNNSSNSNSNNVIPATTMSMNPGHYFPNGFQLNQMWMDSLAKGMTQEQVSSQKQQQQQQQQQQEQYEPNFSPTPLPQHHHQQQQQQQPQQYAKTVIQSAINHNHSHNSNPSLMQHPTNNMMTATAGFPQSTNVNASFSAAPMQLQTTASLIPMLNLHQQHHHHQQQQQQQQQQANNTTPTPSMMSPNNVPVSLQQRMLLQKLKATGAAGAAANFPHAAHLQGTRADQVAAEKERKRKNREFAKRSREKRKNEHKSLEEDLFILQQENARLRQIVQDKIPSKAQEILKNCCKDHPLHHAAVKQGVNDALAMSDFHMLENLIKEQQSFCMTDPMQPDNPIVYASQSFYQLTGYTKEQTLGRNCRFLQGKDTDPKSVALIRESIKNGKDTSVNLLNYKADETPFWNQFFIVALRNHSGKVVNFVGVQCEIEDPNESVLSEDSFCKVIEQKNKCIRIKGPAGIGGLPTGEPLTLVSEGDVDGNMDMQAVRASISQNNNNNNNEILQPLDADYNGMNGMMDDEENRVDWSMLANVLEDDFRSEFRSEIDDSERSMADDNNTASVGGDLQSELAEAEDSDGSDTENKGQVADHPPEAELEYRSLTPRAFVTRTCRSELVASLLSSHGDVTNPRFLKALEVMSSIYASSDPGRPVDDTSFIDNFLNSAWVSLSRPAYDGCLGKTGRGDFVYSLGKMSFNMFKPGHLKCSIQHTLNKIDYVCDMNEARNVVPWSLRRELAMTDEEDAETFEKQQKTLRSYDIEIAMTIQPSDDEIGPKKPLRAIQVVKGYMLRDPNEKNRLSVWFTGGKLSPFIPYDSNGELMKDDEHGSFEDWKAIFDQEYTSSWSESFQNIGAKLFLGAQLPHGVNADGSLHYSLTRPYGGHGKSFIDVLYLDEGLFITRGNSGTIHVMVRSNLLGPTKEGDSQIDGCVKSATEVSGASEPTAKRKASGMDEVPNESNSSAKSSWQEQLRKELANRNPASIADDLSSILQEYGIQIDPATKRAKLD